MKIQLARIDDRLIHGQVVTSWVKQNTVNRIIVVSNEVAFDELRKFLLKEAAPSGVKVNIVTVEKLLEVNRNELFDQEKVMLLFTNPSEVEQLVRGGIHINSLNIGGMSFSSGKQMITTFVSVDEKDVQSFRYLLEQGVEIEVRKVPADRKILLVDLLEKFQKMSIKDEQ